MISKDKGDYIDSMENFRKAINITGPSTFNKLESKGKRIYYDDKVMEIENKDLNERGNEG